MTDEIKNRELVLRAATTVMNQPKGFPEPSQTVLANTFGLANALSSFVMEGAADEQQMRMAAVEMACTTMQATKAAGETSQQFASNVVGAVNEYHAYLSGKKDKLGVDLLGDTLRKPG